MNSWHACETLEDRWCLAGINQPPIPAAMTILATEDKSFGGPLNATDADGDVLSFSPGPIEPSHGKLTIADNGFFIYQPDENYNGSDTFSFVVSDGLTTSTPATVTITVAAVNDLPIVDVATFKTRSGSPATGQLTGSDADQDALTYSAGSLTAAHGLVTINPNGGFSYTSFAGYVGPDAFSVRANDGRAFGPETTISVTVAPPNQLPQFSNGNAALSKNTTLNGSVASLATDADGDPLTFALVSLPTHGSVALNPSGTFAYIPNADYVGPDSFTVKAHDGYADSAVATYFLAVQSGDLPLTLKLPGTTAPVFKDSVKVRLDPTASVSDPDSNISFGNARITALIDNLPSDDARFGRISLSIQSQGTGMGLVTVKSSKVYVNGISGAVASFTGGTYGKPLTITFAKTATEAVVNAVLKQITIQAGRRATSTSLVVNLQVSADGQSATGSKSVTIV